MGAGNPTTINLYALPVEQHNARRAVLPFGRLGRLTHPPAFFGTLAASLRAALAVIHLVFGAFICARFANLCAKATKRVSEFTSSSHVTRRQTANLGAIHIKLYATSHALDALFRETGYGAVVALCSAGKTCVNARLNFSWGISSVRYPHKLSLHITIL